MKEECIVGIVSNYRSNFKLVGKIKELKIKNLSKALKIVGLDDSYMDKDINDLTISELWKFELLTKLDKEIHFLFFLLIVSSFKLIVTSPLKILELLAIV